MSRYLFCVLLCLTLVCGAVVPVCADVVPPVASASERNTAAVITELQFNCDGVQPVLSVTGTRKANVVTFRSAKAGKDYWVAELIDAVPANDTASLLVRKPDARYAVTVTLLTAGGVKITRVAIAMQASDAGRELRVVQQDIVKVAQARKPMPEASGAPAKATPVKAACSCSSVVKPLSGKREVVSVSGSGATMCVDIAGGRPDSYRWFQLTSPNRLVLDLYDTVSRLGTAAVPLQLDMLTRARVGAYQDKVRIVFDLKELPASVSVHPVACGIQIYIGRRAGL